DTRKAVQRPPARRQLTPFSVEQVGAQRLEQPCTAAGGGTASLPQNDASRSGCEGMPHHLTDAEGGGAQGMAGFWRDTFQAGCFDHFNKGGLLSQPAPGGRACLAMGIAYGSRATLVPAGGQHGIERAFAAVCDGNA